MKFVTHLLDHLHMLFLRLCEDQNVVQIHYHNPFSYEGPEDVVHHSLEGGGTIGHSKEHHEGFMSQTSFGHISINSPSILTVSMATKSP